MGQLFSLFYHENKPILTQIDTEKATQLKAFLIQLNRLIQNKNNGMSASFEQLTKINDQSKMKELNFNKDTGIALSINVIDDVIDLLDKKQPSPTELLKTLQALRRLTIAKTAMATCVPGLITVDFLLLTIFASILLISPVMTFKLGIPFVAMIAVIFALVIFFQIFPKYPHLEKKLENINVNELMADISVPVTTNKTTGQEDDDEKTGPAPLSQ